MQVITGGGRIYFLPRHRRRGPQNLFSPSPLRERTAESIFSLAIEGEGRGEGDEKRGFMLAAGSHSPSPAEGEGDFLTNCWGPFRERTQSRESAQQSLRDGREAKQAARAVYS